MCVTFHRHSSPSLALLPPLWPLPFLPHLPPFCFHAMCVPLSLLPFPYNLSHLSHDLFVVVSQAHAHMHVHTHTHKMHTHVRACVHARGFLRPGLVHLRLTSNLMHCRRWPWTLSLPVSTFHVLGSQACAAMTNLCGSGGLGPRLHACQASTLQTENTLTLSITWNLGSAHDKRPCVVFV